MQLDLLRLKKYPRLFLAHQDDLYRALPEVLIILPDNTYVPVLGLSLAGIAIPASGLMGKYKVGQFFDAKIKIFNNPTHLEVKVQVLKITAHMIGLVFDILATDGRLKLDQPQKDQLVINNLRHMPTKDLQQSLQADVWYHGPFDTNVFIWKKAGSPHINKMIVEYDNILWIYNEGKIDIQKSISATSESKGYAAPLIETAGQKISMGASWMARLIKTLEQVADSEGYMNEAVNVLKYQRTH